MGALTLKLARNDVDIGIQDSVNTQRHLILRMHTDAHECAERYIVVLHIHPLVRLHKYVLSIMHKCVLGTCGYALSRTPKAHTGMNRISLRAHLSCVCAYLFFIGTSLGGGQIGAV